MKTASGTVHIKNVKYDWKAHIRSRRKYKSDEEIFINFGFGEICDLFLPDTNINYKENISEKKNNRDSASSAFLLSRQKGKQKGTK